MDNKIQQLTEKLYNDGVSKGKAESDKIVAAANEKGAQIIADAQKEAAQIIERAKKEASEYSAKSLSELKNSMGQMSDDVKAQIEGAVIASAVSADVKVAFADEAFVKELILNSVKAWGENSSSPLTVAVNQKSEAEVSKFLAAKLDKAVSSNVVVAASSNVKAGFTLAPKDAGYYIKFTSDDFDALLKDYLRAQVAEILFGK